MKRSTIYLSVALAFMLLCFGLVQQASSQPENIKVLSYSWYLDSNGTFNVVGEVQNTGSTTVNPVVLNGTVSTPDGVLRAMAPPKQVYVNYMLPQQKAPFIMEFASQDLSWLSQGVGHIDLGVFMANVTNSYQYPDLKITSSSADVDGEGVYWVTGTVQNTGSKTATSVRVIATFFNSSGTVVAAGHTDDKTLTPYSIGPSGSASFKVGAFDTDQRTETPDRIISSYTLLVQTEEPILSGTAPSGSSSDGSSTDTPSDGSSSPAISPEMQYVAIIVIVVLVVAGVLLVVNKRKSGKPPINKNVKPQTTRKQKAKRK